MKELKNKSKDELVKLLAEFRNKLRDLRFKDSSKQLKSVRDIRKVRVDIARVMMLLNMKPDIAAKPREKTEAAK